MVRLGGTSANDARLAAAVQIAAMFDGHITGLFFNIVQDELDGEAAGQAAQSKDAARQPATRPKLYCFQRLTRLQVSTNLRRFDVTGELDMSETALLAARTAGTFVALRPNRVSHKTWSKICFSVPDAICFSFRITGRVSSPWTTRSSPGMAAESPRVPWRWPSLCCRLRKRLAFCKASVKPEQIC
jgi:hypothetical protein